MNMKSTRLDDKLNVIALGTIVAIVLSIGSALVSVEIDTTTAATATTQTQTTAQAVATTGVVAAR
jgi:hypothetical protein